MVQFYKHSIVDWMDATGLMSDRAYRVYHVMIQLIMQNEGPIRLNERAQAGLAGRSTRDFRAALEEIVGLGILTIRDGFVDNSRCEKELNTIRTNREHASNGGRKSGEVRKNSNEIKANDEAPLPRQMKSKREEKTREEKKENNIGADAPKLLTARQELEAVLSPEMAAAVVEHRQKLRKPMTAYAARQMAAKLAQAPDPNAAASVMIEKGWQGFEAGWMQATPRAPPQKFSLPAAKAG